MCSWPIWPIARESVLFRLREDSRALQRLPRLAGLGEAMSWGRCWPSAGAAGLTVPAVGVAENLRLGSSSPHYTVPRRRKSSLDSRWLESQGVGLIIKVLRSGSPNVTSVDSGGPPAASKSGK